MNAGIDPHLIIDAHRMFTHESGHALMAFHQRIPNCGIYFQENSEQWANLVELPESTHLTIAHYLFLASGSAAERIVYGHYSETGAKDDKRYFAEGIAPDFQQTVTEAELILRPRKTAIEKLKATFIDRYKQIGGATTLLPKVICKDIEYREFLPKQRLADELKWIGRVLEVPL